VTENKYKSSLHERRIEAVANNHEGTEVMYQFHDKDGANGCFCWFDEEDLRNLAKDFLKEADDLKSGLHRQ